MSTQHASVYTGIYPIAPTPFLENGDLDLDGMRRVLDCMIDQGVDGICILANYSEQFLLTDAERDLLTDLCLDHVAGRVPVIVTTSHFSTRIASERAAKAKKAGAAMLMLMPPYHGTGLRADENGIVEHFAAIAKASDLPIMVQDAPPAPAAGAGELCEFNPLVFDTAPGHSPAARRRLHRYGHGHRRRLARRAGIAAADR